MLETLTRAVQDLADAVYPRRCHLCGGHADDGVTCARHRLPEQPDGPRCGRCQGRLPPAFPDGRTCAACRRRSPGHRGAVVLGGYEHEALREWLLAFKHGGRRDLAPLLAARLDGRWRVASPRRAGRLVPVPLHPWRRLERGYDQAALLASELARISGLPAVRALRRRRVTGVQGGPGSTSRAANVRDAFAPARLGSARVRGAPVWLVDDVVTSGATVAECARVLRALGAAEVRVLALARASPGLAGGPAGSAAAVASG